MNRYLLALALILSHVSTSWATPVYHPPGPNLTYGAISNPQSIMSEVTNPAAGASALLKEDSRYRFGLLSSLGFGFEFGNVANLYEELDLTIERYAGELGEDITTVINDNTLYPTVADKTAEVVNIINTQYVDEVNNLMGRLQSDGYAKGFASGHLPVMPLVISNRGLGGSFTLDINATIAAHLGFISDPIDQFTTSQLETDVACIVQNQLDGSCPTAQDPTNYTPLLDTDSSLVIRGTKMTEFGLGYSWITWNNAAGNLFAGVRGKYLQAEMTQFVQRLADLESAQSSEDIYDEQKDGNFSKSSAFGIDLGLLWVTNHYRAGVSLDNINKPTFKYPQLDLTDAQGNVNYEIGGRVHNRLRDDSTYEMKPQLRTEGAIFSESTNFVLGAALDLNAVNDPFGQDYQWFTLSAAYAASTWYMPGARVGYRKNIAGTQQNYLGIGLTLFTINFDYAYSLESVTIDGEKIPRSAMFNIGWALTF